MENHTRFVEPNIDEMFLGCFAVVFDRWTTGSVHYVSLFATYPAKNDIGYSKILLAISPVEEETSQSFQKYYGILKFVVSVYNRDFGHFISLIRDMPALIGQFHDSPGSFIFDPTRTKSIQLLKRL